MDGDCGGDNDYDNDDVNNKNDDNVMATMTMKRQKSDGDGLVSAVPPIRGNNQLMSTVWGGVDKREGQFWGTEGQRWVEVEATGWWHLSSTQSIPNLHSGHPGAEKGPETIPHTSWE